MQPVINIYNKKDLELSLRESVKGLVIADVEDCYIHAAQDVKV